MENDKSFTEKDSLRLITEMIHQAKAGYFHDSGAGAILWGSVVSFAGFMTFLQLHFDWKIDFDWWLLTFFALIPQVILSMQERKKKLVRTHVGLVLDTVWIIFGVSIFAIILYINIVPLMAGRFMEEAGFTLLKKDLTTGVLSDFEFRWAFSPGSLFLLIYALPTMLTGLVKKFRPMVIGAGITYLLFIVSLFTENPIDQLMMGISGLINWLIPGLILRKRYRSMQKDTNV
jgi:hypothetical protein